MTWISSIAWNCSSVVFWMTLSQLYPALLTMISRAPKDSRVRLINVSGNAGSTRSPAMCFTRCPAERSMLSVSLRAASSRSLTITAAPALANFVAIARPMPRPAPVTNAVLPSRVNAIFDTSCAQPQDLFCCRNAANVLLHCITPHLGGGEQDGGNRE